MRQPRRGNQPQHDCCPLRSLCVSPQICLGSQKLACSFPHPLPLWLDCAAAALRPPSKLAARGRIERAGSAGGRPGGAVPPQGPRPRMPHRRPSRQSRRLGLRFPARAHTSPKTQSRPRSQCLLAAAGGAGLARWGDTERRSARGGRRKERLPARLERSPRRRLRAPA